jgi:hypothetical protein
MTAKTFDWGKTKQLTAIQLILAFAIPSAVAYVGFRVVLPVFVEGASPAIVVWPIIASVMVLLLVIVSLYFLRSEAKQLNISLAARMCFQEAVWQGMDFQR